MFICKFEWFSKYFPLKYRLNVTGKLKYFMLIFSTLNILLRAWIPFSDVQIRQITTISLEFLPSLPLLMAMNMKAVNCRMGSRKEGSRVGDIQLSGMRGRGNWELTRDDSSSKSDSGGCEAPFIRRACHHQAPEMNLILINSPSKWQWLSGIMRCLKAARGASWM